MALSSTSGGTGRSSEVVVIARQKTAALESENLRVGIPARAPKDGEVADIHTATRSEVWSQNSDYWIFETTDNALGRIRGGFQVPATGVARKEEAGAVNRRGTVA